MPTREAAVSAKNAFMEYACRPAQGSRGATGHSDRPRPDDRVIAEAARLIDGARFPVVIAGGGVHGSDAGEALLRFAENAVVPVATTNMGKGAIAETHPLQKNLGLLGSTSQYTWSRARGAVSKPNCRDRKPFRQLRGHPPRSLNSHELARCVRLFWMAGRLRSVRSPRFGIRLLRSSDFLARRTQRERMAARARFDNRHSAFLVGSIVTANLPALYRRFAFRR